jgi:hypothetical protein
MIGFLITLLVLVLIGSIIWYVVTTLLPLPQPFKNVILAIIAIIFIIYLLAMLLGNAPVISIRG